MRYRPPPLRSNTLHDANKFHEGISSTDKPSSTACTRTRLSCMNIMRKSESSRNPTQLGHKSPPTGAYSLSSFPPPVQVHVPIPDHLHIASRSNEHEIHHHVPTFPYLSIHHSINPLAHLVSQKDGMARSPARGFLRRLRVPHKERRGNEIPCLIYLLVPCLPDIHSIVLPSCDDDTMT